MTNSKEVNCTCPYCHLTKFHKVKYFMYDKMYTDEPYYDMECTFCNGRFSLFKHEIAE